LHLPNGEEWDGVREPGDRHLPLAEAAQLGYVPFETYSYSRGQIPRVPRGIFQFNHPQFSFNPTDDPALRAVHGGSFGQINVESVKPRLIQLVLKFLFQEGDRELLISSLVWREDKLRDWRMRVFRSLCCAEFENRNGSRTV
jgi:hypothetical protein